jgi:hypothetical protein
MPARPTKTRRTDFEGCDGGSRDGLASGPKDPASFVGMVQK